MRRVVCRRRWTGALRAVIIVLTLLCAAVTDRERVSERRAIIIFCPSSLMVYRLCLITTFDVIRTRSAEQKRHWIPGSRMVGGRRIRDAETASALRAFADCDDATATCRRLQISWRICAHPISFSIRRLGGWASAGVRLRTRDRAKGEKHCTAYGFIALTHSNIVYT